MELAEALKIVHDPNRPLPARWWLVGPDAYFGERWLSALAARLGPEVSRRRQDGPADADELAYWLGTPSLFSDTKWLLWRDPDLRSLKSPGFGSLMAVAKSVCPLIIWTEKPGNFGEMLNGFATIRLEPLKGAAWHSWVESEVRERGMRIQREALALIADWTRPSGHHLRSSLEKLQLAYGLQSIGIPEVEEQISPLGIGQFYRLTDAVLRRQASIAYRELRRQLDFGAEPVVLLVVMARQMLALESWLREHNRGMTSEQFCRTHHLQSWQFRTIGQARPLWRQEEVGLWLDRAAEVDKQLKNSRGDPPSWLTGLVMFTSQESQAASADPARTTKNPGQRGLSAQ